MEERLAFVEGRVQELSGGQGQLREDVRALVSRVEVMEVRLTSRLDLLGDRLSTPMGALGPEAGPGAGGASVKIAAVDDRQGRQGAALEGRTGAWMRWLVGTLVVAMAGQVGVMSQVVVR
ncbi:MAG: hypothetical protein RMM30_02375 [Armatimonadota bacterium]|nr:hypothetical protein [Armatimonadota bacterium]MDW8155418.1 hypothetical protein [Armatimonadota bacterium]